MKTQIAALLLVSTLFLHAQPQDAKSESGQNPNPQGSRFQRRDGPFVGGARPGAGMERLFGVLTEDQRTSFRAEMEKDRESVRQLEQKAQELRRALFEAGLMEHFDESAVREKAKALAQVDADLLVIRMKAFSKMQPPLSAVQIQKIRDSRSSEPGDRASPRSRKRSETPRDENGLPAKPGTGGEGANGNQKPPP